MAASTTRRHREVIAAVVLVILLVAGYAAFSSRVDTGVATTVGDQSIAPTCEAPGVSNDSSSSGGGDGDGETGPAQQAGTQGAISASYCQP